MPVPATGRFAASAGYPVSAADAVFRCVPVIKPPSAAAAAVKAAERVAVVVNEDAPDSIVITRHYVKKRGIPGRNVIRIRCAADERIADDECEEKILKRVRAYLAHTRLDRTVDFLVTTRGVPLVTASGLSVDGLLAVMGTHAPTPSRNPYYAQDRAFTHAAFGFYLCTRLDGYTVPDAKALVDRSLAARPVKGLFLLDLDPRRERPGYQVMNDGMRRAAAWLNKRDFRVRLDRSRTFVPESRPLIGYFSWGSNDARYDSAAYRGLRFHPGAIAETVVSTSGRTFRATTKRGQSLIADLISGSSDGVSTGSGVTGVKGYVTEPYVTAMARPDILFPRYVSGRNLGESFYAASPMLHWKDVVIGDPLCAPFAGT